MLFGLADKKMFRFNILDRSREKGIARHYHV